MLQIRNLFILIIIINTLSSNINQKPFNTCKATIQFSKDLNDQTFKEYYDSKNGMNFELEFPFYIGYLKTNLNFNFYKRIQNELGTIQNIEDQNFISIHPNIEWGQILTITKKMTWFNGISLGGYIFHFQRNWDQIFTLGPYTETEISLGLSSMLNYKIKNNYYINFGIKKYTILTYNKINIMSFSIGISKLFNTPLWLANQLK